MITETAQSFTATILEWKRLLKPDKYKDIIIFAFVGMQPSPVQAYQQTTRSALQLMLLSAAEITT